MKKLLLAIFLAISPLAALATNEVAVPDDIILVLPSDSTQYTLQAGSSADSITINSSTFDFVLSSGGIIRIISADKKKLDNNLNRTYSCSATQSSLIITHLSTDATGVTVTVTPSGTCTSADSGSSSVLGGGIISGGGGTSAPTVPPQTPSAPPSTPSPSVSSPAPRGEFITKDLAPRSRSSEVTKLQALLARDKSIYPEGIVSGFFGKLTSEAVKRFQKKYGLPQVGRVGPLTRAKLAEVFGKEGMEAPKPAPQPNAPQSDVKTLQDQIKALQDQINKLKAAPR